jgi:hypothetical protein
MADPYWNFLWPVSTYFEPEVSVILMELIWKLHIKSKQENIIKINCQLSIFFVTDRD